MAESRARFFSTDGSGGISPISQYDDWRRSWHAIVPLSVGFKAHSCLFFYDRYKGDGKLFATDGQGGIDLLSHRTDLDPGWDIVKVGNFGGDSHQELFFYNRALGKIRIYTVDDQGNLEAYRQELGWRESWDTIVVGAFGGDSQSDILLYDRTAGLGEFYTFDNKGNSTLLRRNTGWKKTWDIIVSGRFGGPIGSHSDLLFYRRVLGEAKFFTTDGAGNLSLIAHDTNWRKTWDIIIPGFLGGDVITDDLVFYDRVAGRGRLASTDGAGHVTTLKNYDWRKTWGRIVVGSFSSTAHSDLLFYDNSVRLRLHAVRCMDDDQGRKAKISPTEVTAWKDSANGTYGPAGVVFEFDPDNDYDEMLANTQINSLSPKKPDDPDAAGKDAASEAATAWASQHPGKIVVFFRHGWSKEADKPEGGGFSSGNGNFVAMPGFEVTRTNVYYQDGTKDENVQNRKLFAHEVGHYLGLPHTFVEVKYFDDDDKPLFDDPSEAVVDYLKKKNSSSAATLDNDRAAAADTPPDVGPKYYDLKGWNRADFSKEISISSAADGIKMTFSPDRHNVSSYFNCDNYVRVTPDQARRVREWIRKDHRKALVSGQF